MYYLYHDVNILSILQQTEVGIKVNPVIPDVGFSQDHLTLPPDLEEGLLPLCLLIRQQLPLKGQHDWKSASSHGSGFVYIQLQILSKLSKRNRNNVHYQNQLVSIAHFFIVLSCQLVLTMSHADWR